MLDVCGRVFCLTIDRADKRARQRRNPANYPSRGPLYPRDEAPPAMFLESEGASVRYVDQHSNASLGAYFGNLTDPLKTDGQHVQFELTGGTPYPEA
jgi:hypothetical protein